MRACCTFRHPSDNAHDCLTGRPVSGFADVVAKRPPAIVLAYGSGMARLAMEPRCVIFRSCWTWLTGLGEMAALAQVAAAPTSWIYGREARVLARFERAAAERAFATLVVNEKEATRSRPSRHARASR